MSIEWEVETKAPGQGVDFETPPEGNHPATISALIAVGTHDARNDEGGAYEKPVVIIGYELSEKKKNGSPFFVCKPYTMALKIAGGKSSASALFNLVKMIDHEPQIGEKFSPTWLAGKPCMVQIVHKTSKKGSYTNTFANIAGVSSLPKGFTIPHGKCLVWQVKEHATNPLPDLPQYPPMYHEGTGKALSIAQWVKASREVCGANGTPSQAADVRMPGPSANDHPHSRQPATPMTQAEADQKEEVPF